MVVKWPAADGLACDHLTTCLMRCILDIGMGLLHEPAPFASDWPILLSAVDCVATEDLSEVLTTLRTVQDQGALAPAGPDSHIARSVHAGGLTTEERYWATWLAR